MSLAAVPSVEQIGEAIISDARDLMDHRQAEHPPEPDVARGSQPNCYRAVGADVQPAVRVDRVQPAPHILDAGAEAGERIGLAIDVTEFDGAGPDRMNQPAALPIDSGITDRAFRIVPNCQLWTH